MIDDTFQLLICINGDEHNRPAIDYGIWLAGALGKPATVLGVIETSDRRKRVENLVSEAERTLSSELLHYKSEIRSGSSMVVIPEIVGSGNYLTVIGPLGRPVWWRALRGRSFRRLMAYLETPLIYVPQARIPLKRLLLCSGGLEYTQPVEKAALYLAQAAQAQVTLLHVVEPITMEYPLAREIQAHWQTILETDTPQGRNLRRFVEEIKSSGVSLDFQVRHGSVIQQIIDEIKAGSYDLIAMGSAYSSHSLRHLFAENVTARIAEAVQCPLLTARICNINS